MRSILGICHSAGATCLAEKSSRDRRIQHSQQTEQLPMGTLRFYILKKVI
jgi:hypothetical protein